MRKLYLVFLGFFLGGCVSSDIHEGYRDSKRISIYDTSCHLPFEMTRGCLKSGDEPNKFRLVRASIPVTVNDIPITISATENGNIVYIGFSEFEGFGRSYLEGYTFGILDHKRDRLNKVIDELEAILTSSGASEFNVIPVTNFTQIGGYYIGSDIDIYSVLVDNEEKSPEN